MSTPERPVIDVTPETLTPPSRGPRGTSPMQKTLAALSLTAFIGVAGVLYYAWHHWQGAREQLDALNARTQEAYSAQQTLLKTIDETRAELAEQQQELDKQQGVLDQQEGRIQEQEHKITASQVQLRAERQDLAQVRTDLDERLARVSRRIEGHPARWLDAEAASLLRTAANALELARDRDTALKGLRRADELLEQAGTSRQSVREVLAQEIRTVEAYQPPDTQQLAKTIRQLQRKTRNLPLKAAVLPRPPASPTVSKPNATAMNSGQTPSNPWQRAADRSLKQLRTLVNVRRTAPGQLPVSTAPYENWLRETLRMRLDNARIGALSHNQPLYTTSIETSADLIREVFAENTERKGTLVALDGLADVFLQPRPPQLGATLDALETARRGVPQP